MSRVAAQLSDYCSTPCRTPGRLAYFSAVVLIQAALCHQTLSQLESMADARIADKPTAEPATLAEARIASDDDAEPSPGTVEGAVIQVGKKRARNLGGKHPDTEVVPRRLNSKVHPAVLDVVNDALKATPGREYTEATHWRDVLTYCLEVC